VTDDPPRLVWKTDELLVVGDTTFRLLPDQGFYWGVKPPADVGETDFFVAKPRWLVERYIALIEELQPKHIFELGMFQGGSTALLAELAVPRRLVAIDRAQGQKRRLEAHAVDRGLEDAIRVHAGVDQADRARLAEIVAREFDSEPLDLVVDDCSHLYAETRASFNELFPRLRPQGVFVIEDWPWAHAPPGMGADQEAFPGGDAFRNEEPLTRLIFELILAIPALPGLIAEVTVDIGAVVVRRGDAEVGPDELDISTRLDEKGRALLAPLSAATEA
jgi:SAM-dependent methyltransferase